MYQFEIRRSAKKQQCYLFLAEVLETIDRSCYLPITSGQVYQQSQLEFELALGLITSLYFGLGIVFSRQNSHKSKSGIKFGKNYVKQLAENVFWDKVQ
jgi:hypothetical protein